MRRSTPRAASSRARPGRQHGAVLLLLLVVLGLGGATMLISAFGKVNLESARQQRTAEALAEARDALIGYAAARGRLPRPATSALDGRESGQNCTSDAACSGFLPWVTLGVTGSDAWGKLLRYSVTPDYTQIRPAPTALFGSKVVLSRAADGTLFTLTGRGGCGLGLCAPAVLWSNGRHNLGTGVSGAALANASDTNVDEQDNDSASTRFMRRPVTDNSALAGGEFDDIVIWIGRDVLLTRMTDAARVR
jgi:type II secretory pathway pseudopilin PulG